MVKVRPARGKSGRWEVDIRFRRPDGRVHRERVNAPVTGRENAKRWGEARERELFIAPVACAVVPTFGDFWPRVVREHYEAERKKASTVDAAQTIYRTHLAPVLASTPLHLITTAEISSLKASLKERAAKTTNNVLSILSRVLRCAVEWNVLATMPRVKLLRTKRPDRRWYECEVFRRLVAAARRLGPRVEALVLLAGSAGLRRGEIFALRWTDVDLVRDVLTVRRAIWSGVEDTPKGGRSREVPLTRELARVLKLLSRDDARVLPKLTNRKVRSQIAKAEALAGITGTGAIHTLRHTFCSHLALAGVPARTIQDLAGHADLTTTMRYMHLAPNDRGNAMLVLADYYKTDMGKETATCSTTHNRSKPPRTLRRQQSSDESKPPHASKRRRTSTSPSMQSLSRH